jgi:hypothetical protein
MPIVLATMSTVRGWLVSAARPARRNEAVAAPAIAAPAAMNRRLDHVL